MITNQIHLTYINLKPQMISKKVFKETNFFSFLEMKQKLKQKYQINE